MSIELTVFSNVRLDSVSSWQSSIAAQGFDLRLITEKPLSAINGFLPAAVGTKRAGFECYHDDVQELAKAYPNLVAPTWSCAISFRWGGSFDEALASWIAAAAYATATSGIVFDPEESKTYSAQAAILVARELERERLMFEQAVWPAPGFVDTRLS